MEYISIIYKFHWSCLGHPIYSTLIPRTETRESKFSAFEIRPDDIIEFYRELVLSGLLPEIVELPDFYNYCDSEEKIEVKRELSVVILAHDKFRAQMKQELINRINNKIKSLDRQKYFHGDLARKYREIWEEGEIRQESIENTWIYNQLFETIVDEGKFDALLKEKQEKENARWRRELEREEERYTWEDSYRDAGGGDEWSDPSEFW